MKKVFIIALVLFFIMVGCTKKQAEKPKNFITNNATETVQNKIYIKPNPEKSDEYNAAINAFDKFLSGEKCAITENSTIKITDFTRLSDGAQGIDRYALFCPGNSTIPFLHIQALEHSVLSFENNNIILLYTSSATRTNSVIKILKDGSVYAKTSTIGTLHHFASFEYPSSVTTVDFWEPDSEEDSVGYSMNGLPLTRIEWITQINPYFVRARQAAAVIWVNYN